MIAPSSAVERFRHEALLYANEAEFVAGTVGFVRDGIRNGEPVLVVESLHRIHQLRSALGGDADQVQFADMAEVGANPARIIPAWQDFVDRYPTAHRLRGIGEPIWPGRSADEVIECQRHEALLNTAFATGRPWWLLCPYDVHRLPADVIAEAHRSHELVTSSDGVSSSSGFRSGTLSRLPLSAPFAEPQLVLGSYSFGRNSLAALRHELLAVIASSGLSKSQRLEFVLGVNEIATNSVQHGGGYGTARVWVEADTAVCEIRDDGFIDEPLADRRRPGAEASASRGYWLANQLCDLIQIRSGPAGTAVRLHKRPQSDGPRLRVMDPAASN